MKHSHNLIKHDSEALLNMNDRLKLENADSKEENRVLKEIISDKDTLIEEQRRQIDSAEVEVARLTLEKIAKERKAAGLQKTKIFWKEKATKNDDIELNKSKAKATQTNLQGIKTEIIQVVSETCDSFIKEGKFTMTSAKKSQVEFQMENFMCQNFQFEESQQEMQGDPRKSKEHTRLSP